MYVMVLLHSVSATSLRLFPRTVILSLQFPPQHTNNSKNKNELTSPKFSSKFFAKFLLINQFHGIDPSRHVPGGFVCEPGLFFNFLAQIIFFVILDRDIL